MFADEKGYLVTEMVWEDVSDDGNDVTIAKNRPKNSEQTKLPLNNENRNNNSNDNVDTETSNRKQNHIKDGNSQQKKKQKTSENNNSQKSISSFFGKK